MSCAVAVAGCERAGAPISTPMSQSAAGAPRESGYTPGAGPWVQFLGCWQAESRALAGHSQGRGHPSVLSGGQIRARLNDSQVEAALAQLEQALGVPLPNAYKDFARAFDAGASGASQQDLSSAIRMFPIESVAWLRDVDPEAVKLAEKYPDHPTDAEYLVYGIDQNSAKVRTKYIEQAIVVGRYGQSLYETIVLFPSVRTADGEMEAALLQHAGQFRAPSFAELMRQLSVLETKAWAQQMPPYPQADLKGTCADKLPVAAWWR